MSRIGKKLIEIPQGVTVEVSEKEIKVTGPKGILLQAMHPEINYLCDEILETDHKVPQIYQWREWGYKANQLISALDLLGLQIIERPKEEENG